MAHKRRRRLPYNELASDATALTTASLTLGVGSRAVADVGGNTGGLAQLSTALGPMGTLVGAKHTLRAVKSLEHSTVGKKRRKRYYGY